jgi:polyhydroxybutyrate depolymerase
MVIKPIHLFLIGIIFNLPLLGSDVLGQVKSEFSFQERIKEKIKLRIKERIEKKMEGKPAPALSSVAEGALTKPGDYVLSLIHNEIYRFYKVHIPVSFDPQKSSSLFFALHGGGGDMTIQSNDKYYKLISQSDKTGDVVVFPNGFSKFQSGKLATWNAGLCCGESRDKKIDDVGFIRAIILDLSKKIKINPKRIYALGMSNGGMLSYRIACELSDVFNGIASVAGTDNTIDCVPKKAISILHIHARDDDHVLFEGGIGPKSVDKKSITEFNSVDKTILKWVNLNGCLKIPTRVLNSTGAYCDVYSKCRDGVEVKLCVTEKGGHSWPGGTNPRGKTTLSQSLDANTTIWEFFKIK